MAVSNPARSLPEPPPESARMELAEAGLANPLTRLPADAWQTVARGVVGARGVAGLLAATEQENGLLKEENVEGATLRTFSSRVWLSELLPGIQPRTGMEVLDVPDPQVTGMTEGGLPCAAVRYRYQSLRHLKDHVRQTIHGTLAINSYAVSILGRKVTRPLITHPVEFTFEDGAEPFYALVVRDGITRLASAWAVLAGPDAEAGKAADLVVESLFGDTPAEPAGGASLGERLAAHRQAHRNALTGEFQRATAEDDAERSVPIGQTFVVPADIAVGIEGHLERLLAPEDVFDDAMRSILASVHVEFKAWDTAAQNVEVATRALKRLIQIDDLEVPKEDLQVVYGMAVGRIGPEDLPKEYGDDRLPGTALWRGVQVVHGLTRPQVFGRLKDQAKIIKGGSRMSAKGFADMLGPILDRPWRNAKKAVSKQARNAWGNGGVLTGDVLKEWDPVLTDDFTELVQPAMDGDLDARCTLAVAGGIALIADKLLTRNVGSSLLAAKEKGGVPFRADVPKIVEGLSAPGNELGLWTLALAANRFRHDALPENAQVLRQLIRRDRSHQEGTPYVHLKVDVTHPDKIARDEHGVPVRLLEWDVVWASDPQRAESAWKAQQFRQSPLPMMPVLPAGLREESDPAETDVSPAAEPSADQLSAPVPAARRAEGFQRTLRNALESAQYALDGLTDIDRTAGSWPPVMEAASFGSLRQTLLELQTDLENLRRNIQGDDSLPLEDDDVA
ncbi:MULTISPECIES: hypothetical protein [Streptomyces]|uniref:hypothetical protein n=1 Tax=Streptomyces TaxID=1883 RepID=UPI001E5AA54A|nr:hypothetical protein [Streptomyces tsukubensis]